MTTLLENPIPVIFAGIVVEAMLAWVFYSTGRKVLLAAMAVVGLLVAGAVLLERMVVTETEEVEETLYAAAAALEADDCERLLRDYVSQSALRTRTRAQTALAIVRVTKVSIHNVEVVINRLTGRPTAEARFDVAIHYSGRQIGVENGRYPARFKVELRREGDRWMITDHVEYQTQRL